MAPGRELRFFLDSYHARHDGQLPMVINGGVRYLGPTDDKAEYNERFLIDLTTYEGTQRSERGLPELVNEVEKLRKELHAWSTSDSRGPRVRVTHVTRPPEPHDA